MSDNIITFRHVEAGGHSLRVYESGDAQAEPVLWLHGSGPGVDAMANWRGLLTDLAPHFRNIAPDILGFGESACPDPWPRGIAASVELRAQNTLALLDELKIDATHVVGNSMGGMIAMRMAQMAPTRLRKIVLMGSGGAGGLHPEAAKATMEYLSNPSVDGLRNLMQMFVYDEKAFGIDLGKLAAERMVIAMRPDIARVNTATFDFSQPLFVLTPDQLATIEHETLAIHGREDRVVPVEASYFLSTHLPNAQLHVFPKSGHWAQLEQRDRFKSLIHAFLNGSL
jgi:2-hydroxymuconate-semialdehyde hydrolase